VSEGVSEVEKKPVGRKRSRAGKAGAKMLTLHWVRSGICSPKKQKATLQGLGFTRLGQRVVRPDDPSIRGMVQHVRHLVEIEKD
jgi:large subunit ribosomal protein L30